MINIIFPLWVAVIGGIIVALVEHFVIEKSKSIETREITLDSYLRQNPFKFSKTAGLTILGGLIGAIVFPILAAFLPDFRKTILEAFSFITTDPVAGGGIISLMGVVIGGVSGMAYKQVAGAIIYGITIGACIVPPIWIFGGIGLLIFNFGKWDYIGQTLGTWSRGGFWIGALLGAILGAWLIPKAIDDGLFD